MTLKEENAYLKELIRLRDLQLDIIATALEEGRLPPSGAARIRFDVPSKEDEERARKIFEDMKNKEKPFLTLVK